MKKDTGAYTRRMIARERAKQAAADREQEASAALKFNYCTSLSGVGVAAGDLVTLRIDDRDARNNLGRVHEIRNGKARVGWRYSPETWTLVTDLLLEQKGRPPCWADAPCDCGAGKRGHTCPPLNTGSKIDT